MIDKKKIFLIVGLGLIGGSYARGLKKQGYTVYAIDQNQQSLDYALQEKIIDAGAVWEPDLLAQADYVIFALYPLTMVEWIKQYQSYLKPGAMITDTSGVKCHIVDAVQENLRADLEFIGSHPMAGKEVSGVQYSDENIFLPANYIVTPTDKNTKKGILFAIELAQILQFYHIAILSPQRHDEMIGFVSQLTHAIAVSLMNCNDTPNLEEYTGDSFRDLTRIAKINEKMWSELFLLNKENLVREIDDFAGALQDLKEKLIQEDVPGLQDLFKESTERRARFDKK